MFNRRDTILDVAVNHADDIAFAISIRRACRTRGAPLRRQSHPHACPGWHDLLDYSVVDCTAGDHGEPLLEELKWQHRESQHAAANDLQAWADHDVSDQLAEATCPVLLVCGDDDSFFQDDVFEETVTGLPDCEAVTMKDTGHYPMVERLDRTAKLVCEFLVDIRVSE
ncbi:alpha/beta fold hydrolase [Natrinema halophilum]|uniref:alpha/beta fold hydrolase n=1 Tax=Natrinema halophilum TaxID=1699371 RepID=UPI003CCE1E4D